MVIFLLFLSLLFVFRLFLSDSGCAQKTLVVAADVPDIFTNVVVGSIG